MKSDAENPVHVSVHSSDKIQWVGRFFAHFTNVLRATNPENCRSIGQILLKISFLEEKITSLEKTSFKLTVREILKIKLQYLKI